MNHLVSLPAFDMYGPIHKALRRDLGQVVTDLGATSFESPSACAPVLVRLEGLLAFCDAHIEHEDRVLRPAIEARQPGACAKADEEHAEHARDTADLRVLVAAMRAANDDTRPVVGRTLYLATSWFVARTLEHMLLEERLLQPLLDRLFTVPEQIALHEEILRSLGPAEMAESMERMLPAMSPPERAGLFAGARAGMPPVAFEGLLGLGRHVLSPEAFDDLVRRLEAPPRAA